jgi:RHS repeat-associated protein
VISSAAGQNWQELKLHYKAEQDGFVQVFVYNESGQEVFFDDITIRKDPALIVQENHYDPWGMNLVGIEKQGRPDHKFQYNGKEKQEEFGLNWNDYGARFYDPHLGRWHAIDPMTDTQEQWSPYHYVYGNPVLRTDPDGRCPDGDCPENGLSQVLKKYSADMQKDIKALPGKLLSFTDFNDAVVIGTTITRGSNAINIDESKASKWDKGFAVAGAILPTVSGSAVKKGLQRLGEVVGDVTSKMNVAADIAEGGVQRIQNAANRINKPVHVAGSRASGTAKATSDFDYVIEGMNNKDWNKIKNSLPGAPSRTDNLPRRIDVFKKLDVKKSYITIMPNNL